MTISQPSSPVLQIETLAAEILLHKRRYYAGKANISDEEYDALEAKLRAADPAHPVLALVGTDLAPTGVKVSHVPPMLSLAKTYELSELAEFLARSPCVCMDKFDGMAVALEYDARGVLKRASTRGSGVAGEDVTQQMYLVPHVPKRLRKWSERAPGLTLEARGEVYFPKSAFVQFEDEFDSYRNAVPGTFGRKDLEIAGRVLVHLRFHAYDALIRGADGVPLAAAALGAAVAFPGVEEREPAVGGITFLRKLRFLAELGLETGTLNGAARLLSPEEPEAAALDAAVRRVYERERDYEIDGIVFRYNDEALWESLGNTSHHPRGSLAFKQTGAVAVTRIHAIEENVGRSGKITFRARLEPVWLSNAQVSYATLHNAEFIESGGYAPGAEVRIKRSGEVIPSIIGLETPPPEPYALPVSCPCGRPLTRVGPELFCLEAVPCARKDFEALLHFVSCVDALGVSDKILMRLRNAGLVTQAADLYRVTVADLLQLDGFAQKSAENFVKIFAERREIPLGALLTALGLKRGGAVKCKEVARTFGTLERVRELKPADLMNLKGWAEKSAEDFVRSLEARAPMLDELLKVITVLSEEVVVQAQASFVSGKTVCITGSLSKPREEIKAWLEALGAKVTDSVSKKTHILLCNEPSGSSKFVKAQELGIPVFNEEELRAQLGGL